MSPIARVFSEKEFSFAMSGRSGSKMIGDQDELEYNITFPIAAGSDDSDVKEPVVYLLGWTGAKDRHLAKYSKIYEQEGCITLRYIYDSDDMFVPTRSTVDSLQDSAEKLVQLLEDYDLRENPVLIHCFSNGGSMVYRWTVDALLKENINVSGVTFDSAPSKRRLSTALKAIYYSQRPKGFLHFISFVCRVLFNALIAKLTSSWDDRFDFYEPLKFSKVHLWPHLFLYSASDDLIPAEDILDFVEARKKAGAAFVRTHDFETSPHVLHMKSFKEKYTNLTVQFLLDCLNLYDTEVTADGGCKIGSRISSVDPLPPRPHSEYTPSTSRRKSSVRSRKISQSETKI